VIWSNDLKRLGWFKDQLKLHGLSLLLALGWGEWRTMGWVGMKRDDERRGMLMVLDASLSGQVGTEGVTTTHLPVAHEELLDAGDLTS